MATRGVRYVRPEERWDYIASVYANKMLIESTSEDAVDVISPAHLLQWILSDKSIMFLTLGYDICDWMDFMIKSATETLSGKKFEYRQSLSELFEQNSKMIVEFYNETGTLKELLHKKTQSSPEHLEKEIEEATSKNRKLFWDH